MITVIDYEPIQVFEGDGVDRTPPLSKLIKCLIRGDKVNDYESFYIFDYVFSTSTNILKLIVKDLSIDVMEKHLNTSFSAASLKSIKRLTIPNVGTFFGCYVVACDSECTFNGANVVICTIKFDRLKGVK